MACMKEATQDQSSQNSNSGDGVHDTLILRPYGQLMASERGREAGFLRMWPLVGEPCSHERPHT